MKFVIWLAVNTLALGAATWLLDGITLSGTNQVIGLVIVGAIFGVITSFVRPIVNLLSLPLIILTLGLMLLVVNALMLLLTAWIGDLFDLAFEVDGFWSALLGALVISVVTFLINVLLPDEYEGR